MAGADFEMVVTDEQQERFFHGFILSLRSNPLLGSSRFIVAVERNYGGLPLSSRISQICVSASSPSASLSEDSRKKDRFYGVTMTKDVKERMRISLATLLRLKAVHYAEPFVSRSRDMRDKITTQLRGYRYDVKESGNPNAPKRQILTGKGPGKNDDLCITLNMLAFWPQLHQSDGEACLIYEQGLARK